MPTDHPSEILDRGSYELEIEDTFDGPDLDRSLWLPYYLPQWSSRARSAARYSLRDGTLQLRIDADQEPWCPEFNGPLRVSSLQTGVFSGPLGSPIGQHRFSPDLLVREEQEAVALYAPQYGLFEARARAIEDPANMVALWMIGFEDLPERSAEILIFELFGRDVSASRTKVGMGVHPFGDPAIVDDVEAVPLAIDGRDFHVYAVDWTPQFVAFYVDDRLVRTVLQSPTYPMQFMLNVYEFSDDERRPSSIGSYPKVFAVDWFRGYRPRGAPRQRV